MVPGKPPVPGKPTVPGKPDPDFTRNTVLTAFKSPPVPILQPQFYRIVSGFATTSQAVPLPEPFALQSQGFDRAKALIQQPLI